MGIKVLLWEENDGALHGNQRYMTLLAESFISSQNNYSGELCELQFLLPTKRKLFEVLEKIGAAIKISPGTTHLSYVIWLHKVVRKDRPQVIFCSNQKNLLIIAIAALFSSVPLVWYVKNTRRFFIIDWISFFLAKRILSISPESVAIKGVWLNKIFKRKIYYLPIGIPLDEFASLPTRLVHDGRVRVIMLAAIVPQKGVEVAIKAFKLLNHSNAHVELVLAGSAIDKFSQFAKMIKDQVSNMPNANWVGWTNNIADLLMESDIVILPSFSEGVPRSLVEAMAAGRPVIASRVGGIPGLIEHGVTGLLVEPGDVDGLSNAIDKLATNQDMRVSMGEKARAYVLEHHDFKQHVVLLNQHFKEVAK